MNKPARFSWVDMFNDIKNVHMSWKGYNSISKRLYKFWLNVNFLRDLFIYLSEVGGKAEGEGDIGFQADSPLSIEATGEIRSQDPDVMTWAKTNRQTLNKLDHSGTTEL